METIFLIGNYLELEVPEFIVDVVPISGRADEAIDSIVSDDTVKPYLSNIDEESLRIELKEYGAWTNEELQDHQENIKRYLWIKILDYREEQSEWED